MTALKECAKGLSTTTTTTTQKDFTEGFVLRYRGRLRRADNINIFALMLLIGFYLYYSSLTSFRSTPCYAMASAYSCEPNNCSPKKPIADRRKKKEMPSYYQRKLPATCVPFTSPEGKKIFKSALQNNGLKSFYNLIEQHHTQTEPAFCGVSTRTYGCFPFHAPSFWFFPCVVVLTINIVSFLRCPFRFYPCVLTM